MRVWQSIPGYLSDKIESIQKRALKIISPCADRYSDALELARVETLACRRDKICKKRMPKMKDLNHPLHPFLPTRLDDTFPYTLRHQSDQLYFSKTSLPTLNEAHRRLSHFRYFYKGIFNKCDACSGVL